MITARSLYHVGDEFGCYRGPGFIFLVLSSVRETRNDGSNPSSGSSPTGINHDEKFHQIVVNAVGPRLHDEHVLIPNRFPCNQTLPWGDNTDGNGSFTIRCFEDSNSCKLESKSELLRAHKHTRQTSPPPAARAPDDCFLNTCQPHIPQMREFTGEYLD
jgi:hypothetical protein